VVPTKLGVCFWTKGNQRYGIPRKRCGCCSFVGPQPEGFAKCIFKIKTYPQDDRVRGDCTKDLPVLLHFE